MEQAHQSRCFSTAHSLLIDEAFAGQSLRRRSDCPCSSDVISSLFGSMGPPEATLGQGLTSALELQTANMTNGISAWVLTARRARSGAMRADYRSTAEATYHSHSASAGIGRQGKRVFLIDGLE